MNRIKLGFGWMVVWMGFGLFLEALYALKHPAYLEDPIRREMWRLAHSHGALMGLIFAAFFQLHGFARVAHERLALFGMVVMPTSFFLGGLATTESDPSIGILGAPLAGLCFIVGLAFSLIQKKEAGRKGS